MENVKLVTQRDKVGEEVENLAPSHVAVAYVGKDWAKLIAPARLKEIVLSPTVGTNPSAVKELVTQLGWEKVHFLDQLHAKIYIGSNAVIVGSANLSTNALSFGGADLFEAIMVSSEVGHRKEAMDAFERLRDTAGKAYPTEQAKRARLEKLVRDTEKAKKAGLFSQLDQGTAFDQYKIGNHRILVEWWTAHTEEGFEVEGARDQTDLRFGEEKPQVGDWVLSWRCKYDGDPVKNGSIEWIWVDVIGKSGDDDYPDQVAETTRPSPAALPFVIDKEFKKAFREVIVEDDFSSMRINVEDETTPSRATVEKFLAKVQKQYKLS
jgi:hypothetical protein